MKYTSKQYAEALFLALEKKPKEKQKTITRTFLKVLQKNSDSPKLENILRDLEKRIMQEEGLKKVQLEYPQKISAEVKKDIEKILDGKIIWEEKQNPSLLAGLKILVNDELLIDASARKQLDTMFSKKNPRK